VAAKTELRQATTSKSINVICFIFILSHFSILPKCAYDSTIHGGKIDTRTPQQKLYMHISPLIRFVVRLEHEGLKAMTQNNETMPKARRSVSISKDLMEWVNEQIQHKRFKDVSHAIEYALYRLKEEGEKE